MEMPEYMTQINVLKTRMPSPELMVQENSLRKTQRSKKNGIIDDSDDD